MHNRQIRQPSGQPSRPSRQPLFVSALRDSLRSGYREAFGALNSTRKALRCIVYFDINISPLCPLALRPPLAVGLRRGFADGLLSVIHRVMVLVSFNVGIVTVSTFVAVALPPRRCRMVLSWLISTSHPDHPWGNHPPALAG